MGSEHERAFLRQHPPTVRLLHHFQVNHTSFVYDCGRPWTRFDVFMLNFPPLMVFNLLCYGRDATNANVEWVFAENVKLAGQYKELGTRGYRRLEDCFLALDVVEYMKIRPTPVSPLHFVERLIVYTLPASQRTSPIRDRSERWCTLNYLMIRVTRPVATYRRFKISVASTSI